MTLRTPLKYKIEQMSSSYKKNSPSKQPLRRQTSNFEARIYITARISQQQVMEIKQVFDAYDSNKCGILTPNDLKIALLQNGFLGTKEDIYNIISQFDEEGNGGLNFANFIQVLGNQPSQNEKNTDFKISFKKLDKGNKGYLVKKDLQNMFVSVGQQVNDKILQQIMKKVDKQNQGKITFQNYCKIMLSPYSLY